VQKAWKALHFVIYVLKKGNSNTKGLANTPVVRPILECVAACWDLCREGQINALYRVQKKAAQFINHTKDSEWETLARRRTIARLCALLRASSGEWAWKVIATGCEGLAIGVGFIMFGKLGTGSKERISGIIPL